MYVSRGLAPLADFACGRRVDGTPLSLDDLSLWMSSVKPVTAVLIAQAWEEGLLELDDPVARHLPAFARAGKERVTLRHLLTHTAGLHRVSVSPREQSWDEVVEAVSAAAPEAGWVVGKQAAYTMAATWFVLGEVVQRLAGRPFAEHVRAALYEPIGMGDSWIGMPLAAQERYRGRFLDMTDTSSRGNGKPHAFADPARVAICAPSGNAWGPVRELGYFYEMLLARGERAGVRVLSSQAVEALTAPHRVGLFDETFRHRMDWGLGIIVNTLAAGRETQLRDTQPYGFGMHASPRAFGHGGWQSSVAIADPEAGLVAVVVTNGTPGEARHARRVRELMTALYADLGLV